MEDRPGSCSLDNALDNALIKSPPGLLRLHQVTCKYILPLKASNLLLSTGLLRTEKQLTYNNTELPLGLQDLLQKF